MSSPYFTFFNEIDNRWKVVDVQGFCYGDGATEEEAIDSARIVGVEV